MNYRAILPIGLLAGGLLVSNNCKNTRSPAYAPIAVEGVQDLSDWDFAHNGIVPLSGEYEFYWRRHLSPACFSSPHLPVKSSYLDVPKTWNGAKIEGKTLPGIGYATYRLHILLNKRYSERMAFKFLDMGTAFTVFANGQKIFSAGEPGYSAETTTPKYFPQVVEFTPHSDRIELIYHVSNFYHKKGGAWEPVHFGRRQDIRKARESALLLDAFLFGSLLVIGLYHIGFFIIRREDNTPLYLGLFCILIGIRHISIAEIFLLRLVPALRWETLVTIEYLAYYLALPAFALSLYSFFRKDFSKTVLRTMLGIGSVFCAIVLFTPVRIFSHTVPAHHTYTILCCLYALYVLILGFIRKREGALITLFGFAALFLTIANDILEHIELIDTVQMLPFGLLAYILSQSFLLSFRYSNAFKLIKTQRQILEGANLELRQEAKMRQKTEIALRDSEQRFRKLADTAPVMIWLTGTDKGCTYMNKVWLEFTGRTFPEVLGDGWTRDVHPEDLPACVDIYLEAFDARREFEMEYRLKHRDGTYHWMLERGIPNYLPDGQFAGYVGTCFDIHELKMAKEALQKAHNELERRVEERTAEPQKANALLTEEIEEHKKIERVLRDSEQRFRTMFAYSPDGYYLTDLNGTFIDGNEAAEKISGFKIEELTGNNYFELGLLPEEDLPIAQRLLAEIVSKPTVGPVEFHLIRKNGKKILIEVKIFKVHINNQDLILGIMRDITESKRAEEKIKQAERKFRILFEQAPIMYVVTRNEKDTPLISDCNNKFLKTLGYRREEVVNHSMSEFYTVDSQHKLMNAGGFQRALSGEFITEERQLVTSDGRTIDILLRAIPRYDASNQVIGTLGMFVDITERKRAERALQESENRYRTIVEDNPNLICRFLPDMTLTFVNDTFCGYFEKTRDELVGRLFKSFIPAGSHEMIMNKLQFISKTKSIFTHEHGVLAPSGSLRWHKWTYQPLSDAAGRIIEFQAIGNDITKSKQAEDALRESEEKYRYIFETSAVSIWEEDYSELKSAIDALKAEGIVDFRRYLDAHPEFLKRALKMVKILNVNPVTLKIFDAKNKSQLLGPLDKIFAPEAMPVFQEELVAIARGEKYFESEIVGKTLQGKKIDLLLAVKMPLEPEKYDHILASVIDLTAQKKAKAVEEKLRQKNIRTAAFLEAQEKERRRIAQELHDGLGQILIGIKYSLSGFESPPAKKAGGGLQRFEDIDLLLDQAITEGRRISHNLMPRALDERGLAPALKILVDQASRNTGLKIRLQTKNICERMNPNIEIGLYRIAQEALNNIVQHARTKKVDIVLERHKERITLSIRDDGVGFQKEAGNIQGENHWHGIGLTNMRERAETLNGTLSIRSQPGKGTTIIAELLLPSYPM